MSAAPPPESPGASDDPLRPFRELLARRQRLDEIFRPAPPRSWMVHRHDFETIPVVPVRILTAGDPAALVGTIAFEDLAPLVEKNDRVMITIRRDECGLSVAPVPVRQPILGRMLRRARSRCARATGRDWNRVPDGYIRSILPMRMGLAEYPATTDPQGPQRATDQPRTDRA